jgi:hypothetical protein
MNIEASGGEANGDGEGGEALKPGPGRLLQAIEGIDKLAYMVLAISIDETGRLVEVDLLIEDVVEEGVLHI